MTDNYSHSDSSSSGDSFSHGDSYSPRDGFYDGTADDVHDLHDDSPGLLESRRRSGRGGRADLSGAPGWVKAFVYLGSLLALAGMAVIFLSVFGVLDPAGPISGSIQPGNPSPDALSLQLSPDMKLGFGLFFAGFVLNVIGAIGQGASSQR